MNQQKEYNSQSSEDQKLHSAHETKQKKGH